ncbi:MAG: SDR family oxidoreductase [Rectinemataceae bacterium]
MILVTGATGTIGGNIVAELLAKGKSCRILTRDPAKAAHFDPGVERAIGDLDRPETLEVAFAGIDRVFLVTADTRQDKAVIEAGKRCGLKHIVKLSTQEAGWTPVRGHGHWHYERQELIRNSGLDWTFLQPCMFMSATLVWGPSIRRGGIVRYPGGDGKFAPIDPADIAAAAAAALTEPGHSVRSYELTGPQLLTMKDMANAIGEVLGRPISYADQPEAEFVKEALAMGLPKYLAAGLAETFTLIRRGDFAHTTTAVKDATGREPRSYGRWAKDHEAAFR